VSPLSPVLPVSPDGELSLSESESPSPVSADCELSLSESESPLPVSADCELSLSESLSDGEVAVADVELDAAVPEVDAVENAVAALEVPAVEVASDGPAVDGLTAVVAALAESPSAAFSAALLDASAVAAALSRLSSELTIEASTATSCFSSDSVRATSCCEVGRAPLVEEAGTFPPAALATWRVVANLAETGVPTLAVERAFGMAWKITAPTTRAPTTTRAPSARPR